MVVNTFEIEYAKVFQVTDCENPDLPDGVYLCAENPFGNRPWYRFDSTGWLVVTAEEFGILTDLLGEQ